MADDYKIKAKTWLVLAERFTGRVSVLFFTKDANHQAAVREMFTTFRAW